MALARVAVALLLWAFAAFVGGYGVLFLQAAIRGNTDNDATSLAVMGVGLIAVAAVSVVTGWLSLRGRRRAWHAE